MNILSPTPEQFMISNAPFYLPTHNEEDIFQTAWKKKVPILLKGPTGCGKTRFVSAMAHKLGLPLITVSCHEDLAASDLIGRYLLQGDETIWSDGPMTAAVRMGGILYLDEVVEARKDTIVAIHPLTDHRRSLSIDKLAQVLDAPDSFMLVVSYNPGYQSILKELKPSTKQRFVALEFDYPSEELEISILEKESSIDAKQARLLVKLANKIRNLVSQGLEEGVSTRLLVHTSNLIVGGIPAVQACHSALTLSLTDDRNMQRTISELISDYFV